MGEFFSRGKCGEVRVKDPNEKPILDKEILVKEERTRNPFSPILTYYKHKIVNLLFPNTVIDIIAASHFDDFREIWFDRSTKTYRGFTYSLKVDVDPDHAIYSAHMQIIDTVGRKIQSCPCSACKRHSQKHNNDLKKEAVQLYDKLAKVGIYLPQDDPTDYCRLKNGKIIFFEIQRLEPYLILRFINELKNEGIINPNKIDLVHRLLRRHNRISKDSSTDSELDDIAIAHYIASSNYLDSA